MTVTISGRTGDPKALSSLIAWSRELYPSYGRPEATSPTVYGPTATISASSRTVLAMRLCHHPDLNSSRVFEPVEELTANSLPSTILPPNGGSPSSDDQRRRSHVRRRRSLGRACRWPAVG